MEDKIKLNFIKKSQYLYELEHSPELIALFKVFFNSLPDSDVDIILENEVIKTMLTYSVARYVYSKDIAYAEMWNNVEIVIPAAIVKEINPNLNKSIKMSVSKTDFIDPLTKQPSTKRIYSGYEYE